MIRLISYVEYSRYSKLHIQLFYDDRTTTYDWTRLDKSDMEHRATIGDLLNTTENLMILCIFIYLKMEN